MSARGAPSSQSASSVESTRVNSGAPSIVRCPKNATSRPCCPLAAVSTRGGHDAHHRHAVGEVRALRVDHARPGGDRRADPAQRRDRIGRRPVVVAEQHPRLVGVRTDHRDGAEVLLERQEPAGVLEQDHRLLGHVERERAVRRRVEVAEGDLRPLHLRGRVEHPEPEPRGEQPHHRRVDERLAHQPLMHRGDQAVVGAAAVEVGPGLERHRRGRGGRRRRLVGPVDVADRVAVGDDVAAEAPPAAQDPS